MMGYFLVRVPHEMDLIFIHYLAPLTCFIQIIVMVQTDECQWQSDIEFTIACVNANIYWIDCLKLKGICVNLLKKICNFAAALLLTLATWLYENPCVSLVLVDI